MKLPSLTSAVPHRLRPAAARTNGIASIAAVTGKPTRLCGRSGSPAWSFDPRTTEYIDRRIKEGLSKKEAVRGPMRYVAREVFSLLPPIHPLDIQRRIHTLSES